MRIGVWLIGLAAAWNAAAAPLPASQRLGAELLIAAGDARRLAAGHGGPLERRGLEQRLAGTLASLPLTLRRAGADTADVAVLRTALQRHDWPDLVQRFEALARRHPYDPRPWLTASAAPGARDRGRDLHRATCAGCHDRTPPADALLPAHDLRQLARRMPAAEFTARLWLGVRGTPETGYANPYTVEELGALLAWYDLPAGIP